MISSNEEKFRLIAKKDEQIVGLRTRLSEQGNELSKL